MNTTETKQTAVEWLEFEIYKRGPKENNPPQWLKELYEQAKEMHKQEMIEFAKKCLDKALDLDVITAYSKIEQYYNETFNK
jgi:20S proteasome alpha/beta subunit